MIREIRSPCPIASALDLVGDRWTLVILRDLLNGKTQYSEFLESPERITTSVLAARLRVMEEDGLVLRTPYQLRPKRYAYTLTDKGRALLPVLQELCRWSHRFLPGTWTAPEAFMARRLPDQA